MIAKGKRQKLGDLGRVVNEQDLQVGFGL
jgi:hypothetical protein